MLIATINNNIVYFINGLYYLHTTIAYTRVVRFNVVKSELKNLNLTALSNHFYFYLFVYYNMNVFELLCNRLINYRLKCIK